MRNKYLLLTDIVNILIISSKAIKGINNKRYLVELKMNCTGLLLGSLTVTVMRTTKGECGFSLMIIWCSFSKSIEALGPFWYCAICGPMGMMGQTTKPTHHYAWPQETHMLQVNIGASDHRGKLPQGQVITGTSDHRGKWPQGQVTTGASDHRDKWPQGQVITGTSDHRGKWPQGQVITGTSDHRDRWPQGQVTTKNIAHFFNYTGETHLKA